MRGLHVLHLLLLIAITKDSPHCTGLCRSAISSCVLVKLQCLQKCRVMDVNKEIATCGFFHPASKHTPIPHFSGSTIPHTDSWGFALFTEELITVWKILSQSCLGLFVTGIITDQLWEIWGSIKYRACFVCWPGCLDLSLYLNILCKSPGSKRRWEESSVQAKHVTADVTGSQTLHVSRQIWKPHPKPTEVF